MFKVKNFSDFTPFYILFGFNLNAINKEFRLLDDKVLKKLEIDLEKKYYSRFPTLRDSDSNFLMLRFTYLTPSLVLSHLDNEYSSELNFSCRISDFDESSRLPLFMPSLRINNINFENFTNYSSFSGRGFPVEIDNHLLGIVPFSIFIGFFSILQPGMFSNRLEKLDEQVKKDIDEFDWDTSSSISEPGMNITVLKNKYIALQFHSI